MPLLPDDFVVPAGVAVGEGHHLRPIRVSDVTLDYPAVMGSRERLWSIYGAAWGWPPATMTEKQDRDDLSYHEEEAAARSSFNFALVDTDETRLLGCCYIDPPPETPDGTASSDGPDAIVSWWTVDEVVGTDLAATLDAVIPEWIADAWPFRRPHFGVVDPNG